MNIATLTASNPAFHRPTSADGQLYTRELNSRNTGDPGLGQIFILASTSAAAFSLISLQDGNRWNNAVPLCDVNFDGFIPILPGEVVTLTRQ